MKHYPLKITIVMITLIYSVWSDNIIIKIITTTFGIVGCIMMIRYIQWLKRNV